MNENSINSELDNKIHTTPRNEDAKLLCLKKNEISLFVFIDFSLFSLC